MNVYTVRYYGEPGVDGVYSTLELAKGDLTGWVEQQDSDGPRQWLRTSRSSVSLVIEEHTVDGV